ncbi:MAG: hypothetical protein U0525_05680 [Patescibacteria group bacterium]
MPEWSNPRQRAAIFDVITYQIKKGRSKAADIHAAITSTTRGKQYPSTDARELSNMTIDGTCIKASYTDPNTGIYRYRAPSELSCRECPFRNMANMCTGNLQNSPMHRAWLDHVDSIGEGTTLPGPTADALDANTKEAEPKKETDTPETRLLNFIIDLHSKGGDKPIPAEHLTSAPFVPCLRPSGGTVARLREGNAHNCDVCHIFDICTLPKNIKERKKK